jgi:hypothetical protein
LKAVPESCQNSHLAENFWKFSGQVRVRAAKYRVQNKRAHKEKTSQHMHNLKRLSQKNDNSNSGIKIAKVSMAKSIAKLHLGFFYGEPSEN